MVRMKRGREIYQLSAPPKFIEMVDKARGDIPRSVFIRRAVEKYLRVKAVVPDVVESLSSVRRDVAEIKEELKQRREEEQEIK